MKQVRLFNLVFILILSIVVSSCQSSGGGGSGGANLGNEKGSTPVNEQEAKEYKSAILKCYKTGGSRVVKIEGHLKCF